MPEQRAAGDPQTDRTVARPSRPARLQHAAIAGKYWEELFRFPNKPGLGFLIAPTTPMALASWRSRGFSTSISHRFSPLALQGNFDLPANEMGLWLAALGHAGVRAFALDGLHPIVHGGGQNHAVGRAQHNLVIECLFAHGSQEFSILHPLHGDPIVGSIRHGFTHPFSGKFDLCLVRRNMSRSESYRATRAVDVVEREIEINRALPQQNIVAVRPRGGRSLLEIAVISPLRKLARPYRQPDIDIESEEVGYRTDEPRINLG